MERYEADRFVLRGRHEDEGLDSLPDGFERGGEADAHVLRSARRIE